MRAVREAQIHRSVATSVSNMLLKNPFKRAGTIFVGETLHLARECCTRQATLR
jgi:hypothetical protein